MSAEAELFAWKLPQNDKIWEAGYYNLQGWSEESYKA